MIRTLADALDLSFNRIQFTPDLMPADITGTEIIEENKASGAREVRFLQGPLFSHVVLADEINRTPPKTQAALLEAMQERHAQAAHKARQRERDERQDEHRPVDARAIPERLSREESA